METLKNKHILITGATGGIGAAAARMLAGSGARLFLTGRNADKLAAVAASCQVAPDHCFAADITQLSEVLALKEQYFRVLPSIDILVNAAGTGIIRPLEQLDEALFMQSLQVNLYAPFLLMRAFLPVMKENRKGLVIHIPGVLGKVPMAGAAAYTAAKYGLVGMLQSIREELKRTEIRITQLYLGGTDSPFWDTIDLKVQREKMISAEEAGRAIWFLCQQPSSGVVSEMVLQPFNHQAI